MKKYIVPTVEIQVLPQEDVIRTSVVSDPEEGWTGFH